VEATGSHHRLLRSALAIPTLVALAAASYAVHGSVAAVRVVYGSLWRRRQQALQRRVLAPKN
jgi:hypothetical protein